VHYALHNEQIENEFIRDAAILNVLTKVQFHKAGRGAWKAVSTSRNTMCQHVL